MSSRTKNPGWRPKPGDQVIARLQFSPRRCVRTLAVVRSVWLGDSDWFLVRGEGQRRDQGARLQDLRPYGEQA